MPPKKKQGAAPPPFSRTAAIVELFLEAVAEARVEADPDNEAEDAAIAPCCYDVEGRGGCALFSFAGATDMRLVPHAAPAKNYAGEFYGDCFEVTPPERYLEMKLRRLVSEPAHTGAHALNMFLAHLVHG